MVDRGERFVHKQQREGKERRKEEERREHVKREQENMWKLR